MFDEKKYKAEHYRRHRKAYIDRARLWAKNNTEKRRATCRKWVKSHPEHVNRKHAEWKKANPEHNRVAVALRRARKLEAGGEYTAVEFSSLKKTYGKRCLCCGLHERALKSLGRKLVADHVIALSRGGDNSIRNIQPLCHGPKGCNNKKGAKNTDYRTE